MRTCNTCGETKPLEDFGSHPRCKDGRKPQCKACISKAGKEYRDNNPVTVLDTKLRSRYKIDLETYNRMLDEQGGVCAICGDTCSSGKALAVDHDHACCPGTKSCGNCIRKLLCMNCNTILGRANDDVSLLRKCIQYLERIT